MHTGVSRLVTQSASAWPEVVLPRSRPTFSPRDNRENSCSGPETESEAVRSRRTLCRLRRDVYGRRCPREPRTAVRALVHTMQRARAMRVRALWCALMFVVGCEPSRFSCGGHGGHCDVGLEACVEISTGDRCSKCATLPPACDAADPCDCLIPQSLLEDGHGCVGNIVCTTDPDGNVYLRCDGAQWICVG